MEAPIRFWPCENKQFLPVQGLICLPHPLLRGQEKLKLPNLVGSDLQKRTTRVSVEKGMCFRRADISVCTRVYVYVSVNKVLCNPSETVFCSVM